MMLGSFFKQQGRTAKREFFDSLFLPSCHLVLFAIGFSDPEILITLLLHPSSTLCIWTESSNHHLVPQAPRP